VLQEVVLACPFATQFAGTRQTVAFGRRAVGFHFGHGF